MVAGALRGLAVRLYGLELLVGPYAVAHYRLHHALGSLKANERVGVYLADTLAEPGAAAPLGSLGFVAENIRAERIEADRVKAKQPILAIIGNPPYKRLAAGEIGELVGGWMDGVWDDLKAPVRNAGWANQLNTFPELSVAFWRWAMWKMFESDGAPQRGVIAMITNRTFLAGKPYAGLRATLRQRFDRIEVIDLRGDVRRGARAGVEGDAGVFNIQVGTAITLAIADGSKAAGALAEVRYTDMWKLGLFDRKAKLGALAKAGLTSSRFDHVTVDRNTLEDWKPVPFQDFEYPNTQALFVFKSSGIETSRDHLSYGFSKHDLSEKIGAFQEERNESVARETYSASREGRFKAARAEAVVDAKMLTSAYRPSDTRILYNDQAFIDWPRPGLQAAWGSANIGLIAMPNATATGPAIWCHTALPDRHAFRGSYGGYVYPLYDRRPGQTHNITPVLLTGLALAYGRAVAPGEVFDAILALLSATSYSLRFAEDLEDVFPHVPFPADRAVFESAVALGAQIRAIETFASSPGETFATVARIETDPAGPLAASEWSDGGFFLCADGSGQVMNVPHAVWTFAVSGYRLLPRWLEHRRGQPCDLALMKAMRDVAARIAALIMLFDAADPILATAGDDSLTTTQLGLAPSPAMSQFAKDGEPD